MNAGVMGLGVNATKLATISDNISNSATKGYKRSDVEFSAMVIGDSQTRYTAGGVRATPFRHVDQQGAIISTANVTDLAIGGRGFLPVINESSLGAQGVPAVRLTTTGSFRPDESGFLKTATGQVLMGWPAVNGSLVAQARESFDGLEPVQIAATDVASAPTTEVTVSANLPASATGTGATVTDEYPISVSYYDSLGGAERLNLIWSPTTTANQWILSIRDGASNPGGATPNEIVNATVNFVPPPAANAGALLNLTQNSAHGPGISYDPALGNYTLFVERPAAGDPGRALTLRFGASNDLDGDGLVTGAGENTVTVAGSNFKQLEADFTIATVSKNGAPAAVMTGIEVEPDGRLSAIFDTGLRQTLYQIPVAMVRNPNGLQAEDFQTYKVSFDSGDVYFYDAGDGPTGELISSALEESTTDIAEELTQMIKTQRAYSSNAKVIQTSDEMLQETTNLKR
jgi:flagellar hook protein FlgE